MKESMTDYEKLIKEARTLEGLYFKGDKLIQSCVIYRDEDSYSVLFKDIKDVRIYETDWFIPIEDTIEELDNLRKLCYKPLEAVQTINILADKSDDYLHHHNACHYLKNLSSDLTVKYVDNSDDLTDINLINKEIKRFLDEKYN